MEAKRLFLSDADDLLKAWEEVSFLQPLGLRF
jgi:hypothetical protein